MSVAIVRLTPSEQSRRAVKPGTARRALEFAAAYRWYMMSLLLILLSVAAIGIANPLVYREIMNQGIIRGDVSFILRCSGILVLLGLLSGAMEVAHSYVSAKIGTQIVLDLRVRLFEHVQRMPVAFFMHAQTGSLVSRFNNDIEGARMAVTDILTSVAGNIITVTFTVGAMLLLSWRITLAALLIVPAFVLPARRWGKRLQQITRESYSLTASLNAFMVERFSISGAQLCKLFGRPVEDRARFRQQAARVSDIAVKSTIFSRLLLSGMLIMASAAAALSYGWGGVLVVRHLLDVGTVVALAAYLNRLYGPLAGLSTVQVNAMNALVSFERVFEILDIEPMIQEKPQPLEIPEGPVTLSFDRVFFRYPRPQDVSVASLDSARAEAIQSERPVLQEVTFTARAGELLAIVGPSGTGKTTVTQLMARLYDVDRGSVKINSVDVRDVSFEGLGRRIGIVTQDPHLFHDTIRANLQYAKPDSTETEMEEALRVAQLLPLVYSLPKGLDTVVGERGYCFSGGEKQRLAIARLALKKPDVIILDEATSHLDSRVESDVQKSLRTVLAGRTAIVVAHRLSTIRHADQILVMEYGRIVQRGRHEELVGVDGLYAELCQRQAGNHELPVCGSAAM